MGQFSTSLAIFCPDAFITGPNKDQFKNFRRFKGQYKFLKSATDQLAEIMVKSKDFESSCEI
jgi:hypothetical protein